MPYIPRWAKSSVRSSGMASLSPVKTFWRNWINPRVHPVCELGRLHPRHRRREGISDELQVKKIFDNVLIAAVTGIVVVAIAGASVIVFGTIWAPLASGSYGLRHGLV